RDLSGRGRSARAAHAHHVARGPANAVEQPRPGGCLSLPLRVRWRNFWLGAAKRLAWRERRDSAYVPYTALCAADAGEGTPVPWRRDGSRINTNSSAVVGCTATVPSKSRFVAPQVSATARAWMISGASVPIM